MKPADKKELQRIASPTRSAVNVLPFPRLSPELKKRLGSELVDQWEAEIEKWRKAFTVEVPATEITNTEYVTTVVKNIINQTTVQQVAQQQSQNLSAAAVAQPKEKAFDPNTILVADGEVLTQDGYVLVP